MTSSAPASIAERLVPWFRSHARDLPWRRTGFGAWGTLVSEFMLQQTPVSRVIPRLEAWLDRWPTATDLANDSPAEAVRMWDSLGYPRRALWLHRAARDIRDRFDGVVPDDVDALLELTGVGDYTARAVASFAYGQAVPVVDTNTRRVIARAVHARSHPADAHRRDLDDMAALLPPSIEDAVTMNQATMELGQTICTARRPACDRCPIADVCAWRAAGSPDTGDSRTKQSRFEGSDRQTRGLVLRALREAAPLPIRVAELLVPWPDAAQRDRAIVSLLADGLIETDGDLARLPRG